ncbi:MAG: hypothetical protein ABR985_20300 [Methanotrichaceae archaeon]
MTVSDEARRGRVLPELYLTTSPVLEILFALVVRESKPGFDFVRILTSADSVLLLSPPNSLEWSLAIWNYLRG